MGRPLVALAAALLGCAAPTRAPGPRPEPDAEARATARSFLICAERAGAECRPETAPYEAWAALQVLARLRQAVPTLVLARLDEWLGSVRDPAPVRRAFVQALQELEPAIRAAECGPAAARRLLARGTAPLAEAAIARSERLGLLSGTGGPEIAGLPALAAPMGEARLVEVGCARTGRRFFLVLAPRDGGFQVVAVTDRAPALESGGRPGAPLAISPAEGVVSPWLPVPEEAL